MVKDIALQSLSWHGKLPLIQDYKICIPDDIINQCTVPFSHIHQITDELIQDKAYPAVLRMVKEWLEYSLNKIKQALGLLLMQPPELKYTEIQLRLVYFMIASVMGKVNTRYGLSAVPGELIFRLISMS